MTCQDAIAILGDYLEAALGPEVLERLEEHLRDCEPCVAYLRTYRRTRALVGEGGRVEPPEEMTARLRRFLLERLREAQP